MKADLLEGLLRGDRRCLAKAITLIEDARPESAAAAEQILRTIMPHTGQALRLGISGVPGVGKSTFIESFGKLWIQAGKKVAVLAVDPSSPISGGSILGDRTRMADLSSHEMAFIRPSPSDGTVGGVARKTRESILLCEAAGYDVVLVETVGVGQGEYIVASMVDEFIILHMPGSGDDLQGIKRGILELADMVVVTKADGDLKQAAKLAASQLTQSLHLTHGEQTPPVLQVSCVTGEGLEEVLASVKQLHTAAVKSGEQEERRSRQAGAWFDEEVGHQLQAWADRHAGFRQNRAAKRQAVTAGNLPASVAARQLIEETFSS